MFIKQLSIFVENKFGRLEAILDCLSKNNINLRALSLADTTDYGVLRVIVDDAEKAKKVLNEAGIIATILILIAELLFAKFERYMLNKSPEINLFIEYTNKESLDQILKICRDENIKVLNLEITRSTEKNQHNACAIFSLRLNKKCSSEHLINTFLLMEGVISVDEL